MCTVISAPSPAWQPHPSTVRRAMRSTIAVGIVAVVLQLSVLMQPGAATFITNVSVNDIPSGWLAATAQAEPRTDDDVGAQARTPASVIMHLAHRKQPKTVSASNIWSPNMSRRVGRVQTELKASDITAVEERPRLVAQRLINSRPVASLEDFSAELKMDPVPEATTTTTIMPTMPTVQTTTTMPTATSTTTTTTLQSLNTAGLWDLLSTHRPQKTETVTPVIDIDIDLEELADELTDVDESSFGMVPSNEEKVQLTEPTASLPAHSPVQELDDFFDPFQSLETLDVSLASENDDDDSDFFASDSGAETKAKRAIGNEQQLPANSIIRPAKPPPKPSAASAIAAAAGVASATGAGNAKAAAKKSFADILQNETSAERAERMQRGIQRLMHFITIVGHVDSYLTKRFRTGVKKMARLYDSTEDAHRHKLPTRRRRRVPF